MRGIQQPRSADGKEKLKYANFFVDFVRSCAACTSDEQTDYEGSIGYVEGEVLSKCFGAKFISAVLVWCLEMSVLRTIKWEYKSDKLVLVVSSNMGLSINVLFLSHF